MTTYCTQAGCERTVKARGLCDYHYSRGRKEGWLQKLGPREPAVCSAEGCPHVVVAKGLCNVHYRRRYRLTGERVSEDSPLREREPYWECSAEGCLKRHMGDGLCRSHGSTFDVNTATSKICDACGQDLPLSSFYKSPKGHFDRRCVACSQKRMRIQHIQRTYGEHAAAAQERLDANEPCGICGEFKPGLMCVDHCHDTGAVRGILCRTCNAAIGQLGDSVDMLKLAVKYLEETCAS